MFARRLPLLGLCLLTIVSVSRHVGAQDAAAVRPQALLNFTFDEADGPAVDSATAGQSKDDGQLMNGAARVPSPFWNQAGKKALQLDPARSQFVQIPDGADVDRPDAVSFSLLAINLSDANDAAYHGLVAKRGTVEGKVYTNYGINFTNQADNFQVYLSDGSGYQVVSYSAKAALPPRKLIHLTATYLVADAPGSDADTDADDVRIQLFANGVALAPKASTRGFVQGTEGWIVDVNPAGLVNNLPLTIGRSEEAGEYFHGVVDEFCLFHKALTPDEAKKLFLEVGGANVESLIKDDEPAPARLPEVARLSQPGLQLGQSAQLAIVGKNLLPQPEIVCPAAGVTFALVGEPTAERLTAKVEVAATATPGIYPLWVRTAQGISAAEPLVVDALPQRNIQQVAADKPGELPAAFYGVLSGGQEARAYFRGVKGQRVVADVELRRLGGQANPVLELKSAQGTPLEIAWGQSMLGGDARLEAVLPADGLYYVELHDLVYRAPGANSFRLKVGDLRLMDLPFPVAAAPGPVQVEPVGVGFGAGVHWATTVAAAADASLVPLSLPADSGVNGPWPVMRLSSGVEVLETPAAEGQLQRVVATFTEAPPRPVGINGRLLARGERDRYLLQVTPGQKLRCTLQSTSLSSPVEGEIAVLGHPQGNPLAMTGDQPAGSDPALDFTVPANVTEIQVAVRDLFQRGGPAFVYRLEITPAEWTSFQLTVGAPAVTFPADGSAFTELTVTRAGYNGPIALRVAGDPGVQISPAEIPAGQAGRIFCRLQRTAPPAAGATPWIKIVASSVGVEPAVVRTAQLATGGAGPAYRDVVAAGTIAPAGLQLELTQPPAALFRGVKTALPLKITRQPGLEAASKPVRLSLRSTEAVRPRQPGNPAAGNFPVISALPAQVVPVEQPEAAIVLDVPLEVADNALHFVILGEAVTHAYSERVVATAYAQPFRAEIKNAVSPALDEPTLTVVGDADHAVTGKLQRTPGFTGPIEVTLTGLPQGYTATTATVPGDQDAFTIVVKAPKPAAEQAVPNVKLRVTSQGAPVLPENPVNLKVK